jgi:hypothetical protein
MCAAGKSGKRFLAGAAGRKQEATKQARIGHFTPRLGARGKGAKAIFVIAFAPLRLPVQSRFEAIIRVR